MLTRYAQEVRDGVPNEVAIQRMLRTSGQVVVISGSVLMLCYSGGIAFASGLRSVAVGAMAAIGSNVFASQIIIPNMLRTFDGFFAMEKMPRSAPSKIWSAHAKLITSPRGRVVPVVVIAILVLGSTGLSSFSQSTKTSLVEPRGSPLAAVAKQFYEDFPSAATNPTLLVVKAPGGLCDVYSTCFRQRLNTLIGSLLKHTTAEPFKVSHEHFQSMSFINTAPSNVAPLACSNGPSFCKDACCLTNTTAEYLMNGGGQH